MRQQKKEEKKRKLDSFHHRFLGFIDSDSLSTSLLRWEQLEVAGFDMGWNTAEAWAEKIKIPPCCLKKLSAVTQLKAGRTEAALMWSRYRIQPEEVFNPTPAVKTIRLHRCRTLDVRLYFLFLTTLLRLNWVGDKNPEGHTSLLRELISKLLQKRLENRSGLTWIRLHWSKA